MKDNKSKIIIFSLGILFVLFIKYNIGIPCIFNKITGLYCPGCGMTRSVISLIKLNFYLAFRYNMLIILIIPVGILYLILKKNIPNWIWCVLLLIVILFGILRNIPMFNFLAPTYCEQPPFAREATYKEYMREGLIARY